MELVLLKDVQRFLNKSAAVRGLYDRTRAWSNESFRLAIDVSPYVANRSGDCYRKNKALPDIRCGRTRKGRPSYPFSGADGDGNGIAEAIAFIALVTYANLFNHVFATELDFPAAPDID